MIDDLLKVRFSIRSPFANTAIAIRREFDSQGELSRWIEKQETLGWLVAIKEMTVASKI